MPCCSREEGGRSEKTINGEQERAGEIGAAGAAACSPHDSVDEARGHDEVHHVHDLQEAISRFMSPSCLHLVPIASPRAGPEGWSG